MKKFGIAITVAVAAMMSTTSSFASGVGNACDIDSGIFEAAVDQAYEDTLQFGFGLGMWATLMNKSGKVCYVYSVDGATATDNGGSNAGATAWLGSRVISAQKANTANQFSLDGLAISTGALSAAVYPGGSLYGLQHSNPVDTNVVYKGAPSDLGTTGGDPLVGKRPGGVNVFGGGVALYNSAGIKIGSVGVSGDTSCRDHTMAYRLRAELLGDNQPNDDGLELVDTTVTPLSALFQQPACGVNDPTSSAASNNPTDAGDFGIR